MLVCPPLPPLQGAIPDFLASGSLTDETRLVLLNALSFQALWKVPFDPEQTAERMFHCANGSAVPVPMMTLANHFQYGTFRRFGGAFRWPAVDVIPSHDSSPPQVSS